MLLILGQETFDLSFTDFRQESFTGGVSVQLASAFHLMTGEFWLNFILRRLLAVETLELMDLIFGANCQLSGDFAVGFGPGL